MDISLIFCFVLADGQSAATDLNSLIAHAHRRIDHLQRQLAEQQTLEPVRVQSALDAARLDDEKEVNEQVAVEREKAAVELELLRRQWVNTGL